MKKLACLLLCLGTPTLQANSDSLTGFYVTGGVGAGNLQMDVEQHIAANIPNALNPMFPSEISLYGTTPSGQIALEYLYEFSNHFILGGEVQAAYTPARVNSRLHFDAFVGTDILLTNHTESELKNDFALLLKAGYAIKKTTFYAMTGPRWGNFATTTSSNFSFPQPPDLISTYGNNEVSGYELGFSFGLGIRQIVAEELSLGLEYLYTNYGEITAPKDTVPIYFNSTPVPDSFLSDSPEMKAITNSLFLTLSYRFRG